LRPGLIDVSEQGLTLRTLRVDQTRRDVENLVLYNIDATAGGCFRLAVRHGVRLRWRPARAVIRRLAGSYQYRLISPGSNLSHWRPVRRLAGFAGALYRLKTHRTLSELVFREISYAACYSLITPPSTSRHRRGRFSGAGSSPAAAALSGLDTSRFVRMNE
jgi:hypothetical protein